MKSQLFEVTHATIYTYEAAVSLSHSVLRLAPRLLDRQRPLLHSIEFIPSPSVSSTHTDYFGNEVHFATIDESHRELHVTAQSTVAVGPSPIPEASETQPWERVSNCCFLDHSHRTLEAAEFTFPSPQVPVAPRYADYARPSFAAGRPLLDAVIDLTARIHRDFIFDPEATTLATPLDEVLKNRRGVCQDFAHLQIACLRSLGLPARYVSGYLETQAPPGQPKLMGVDASHAWVSFFCPGIGWIDADPTNNVLPSMQHITVAWGRDYGDVCPVRGVASGGGGDHLLKVAVSVVAQGVFEAAG